MDVQFSQESYLLRGGFFCFIDIPFMVVVVNLFVPSENKIKRTCILSYRIRIILKPITYDHHYCERCFDREAPDIFH
jgi:hypothetical protein